MRPFRVSVSFACWLIVAAAAHAQVPDRSLPAYLRGPWTTQPASFGERQVTLRLPDGWSLQDYGIAVSEAEKASECRIAFLTFPGNFEQRLAGELADDRKASRYAIHSELFHAGGEGGVKVVSVRYTDDAGRLVQKSYFELPSDEGSTLLEWSLRAQSTSAGNDCAKRFGIVTGSLRLTPKVNGDVANPN
jgi:hypothetical protein